MEAKAPSEKKVIPIVPQAASEPPAAAGDEEVLVSLYQAQKTIYPRSVSGFFSN